MWNLSMPITFSIDHAARKVIATATGPVTYAEILDHLEEEDRSNCLPYAELIIATDATAAFSTAEVRWIVDYLRGRRRINTLGRTAIVVRNETTFGMLRMLSILLEEVVETAVFRNKVEAVEWLDW
jgi:hypothetical protein